MRGRVTHLNVCHSRPRLKITKLCCRGTAHHRSDGEHPPHFLEGGVDGSLIDDQSIGVGSPDLNLLVFEWVCRYATELKAPRE